MMQGSTRGKSIQSIAEEILLTIAEEIELEGK
jgi:hypothetical protein